MKTFKFKVIIGLLILTILSLFFTSRHMILGLKRVEDNFNKEYYQNYSGSIFQNKFPDSDINQLLNITERSMDKKYVSKESIESAQFLSKGISKDVTSINHFYQNCYLAENSSNEFTGFFFEEFLMTLDIPFELFHEVEPGQYQLNEDRYNYLKNELFLKDKIVKVRDLINTFKNENADYLHKLEIRKGKGFVKDGLFYELHMDIDKELQNIDLSYIIGDNAPKDEIIPGNRFSSDIFNRNMTTSNYSKDREYSIIDTEMGIYFEAYARYHFSRTPVKSIAKTNDLITITLDEKGTSVYSPETSGNLYRCVLRGLKPGDSQKYKFKVINTKGEEYTHTTSPS